MADNSQVQLDQSSKSDYEQILNKLAETQDQLHKAQEKLASYKIAEKDYQFQISSYHEQIAALRSVTLSNDALKREGTCSKEVSELISRLKDERSKHTKIIFDMQSELDALRKDCDNRQIQWNSEKALLDIDLQQLRTDLKQSGLIYSEKFRHHTELTHAYVRHSEKIIRLLQQKLLEAGNVNETIQNDMIKLLIDKELLNRRLCEFQSLYFKTVERDREIVISHAAVLKRQGNLISSLRSELRRSLTPITGSNVRFNEGEVLGSGTNIEEAALIKEFNSNLFEKLAASEDQIGSLKKKVQALQSQLWKSRQEVNYYVHRVKTGALIIESNGSKTDVR